MTRKRLLWQIYPTYILVTMLSLLAVTWYTTKSIRESYLNTLRETLESHAEAIAYHLQATVPALETASVDPICKQFGVRLNSRVTFILPDGVVIGESEENPERLENHKNRPEIQTALGGSTGFSIRHSSTIDRDMMYIAIPYRPDGQTAGILRVAVPSDEIDTHLMKIYSRVAAGGFIIAVIAAVISLMISQRISRPLETLRQGAIRFANGDLKNHLDIPDSEEIGSLADAMNQMAAQLDDRIRTITQQRREQEAVLSSMIEGVLAVDSKHRVISINQTAAKWLDISADVSEGRTVGELITNPDLFKFINKVQKLHKHLDEELIMGDYDKRFLQAHGSPLYDSDQVPIGSVIVLHDVTRLRKLENIRRDFVANVSHELKTPITSIKGFVETLLDGAMENPEDTQRFLQIIAKQSERLHAIIEDLLSLSRIEQDEERNSIHLDHYPLHLVIEAALECCRPKAEEKNVRFHVICSDRIEAEINSPLLEQALLNLIDNAVKYSRAGGVITIEAARYDYQITISVKDSGCGIQEEHLPRIFERFYRVDKARSRTLGGTGLGLAIVKHISQAHGGFVDVKSKYGEGTTFTIHLPVRQEA